jgi:DegV family protein with EDD domain
MRIVIDDAGGSAAQGYMAIEAARMTERGSSIEEILSRLRQMREQMVVVFLIDSLEYAVKGGRVSSLQSAMASLLRIKPIMHIHDGLIVEAGKVRTYGRALDYIVDFVYQRVGNQPVKTAYIHAGAQDGVTKLQERAGPMLNATEVFTTEMAIGVAINLGPGALGIVAIPENKASEL